MKKRLILITSIVAILLVMGIYIKVETQTKPAPQRLTHPYHVKIFRCDISEYYVTTKENVRYTLDDYLRDELNSGYILKSIEDLPQIPESGYSPNSHRQIRVITEFSDEARTHPAYGRRADPPVQ
jgi:hypothetical protein